MIRRRLFGTLLLILLGCATGSGAQRPEDTTAADGAADELSKGELAKLDGELRERVQSGARGRFPVRVSFEMTPSSKELMELMLARYEREYGVGRVDRDTLHAIVSKDNVVRVSYVDIPGYGGTDEKEETAHR